MVHNAQLNWKAIFAPKVYQVDAGRWETDAENTPQLVPQETIKLFCSTEDQFCQWHS